MERSGEVVVQEQDAVRCQELLVFIDKISQD
jgi:hypothetical protein